MQTPEDLVLAKRIQTIRALTVDGASAVDFFEAVSLALTVLHDTVGASHPVVAFLNSVTSEAYWKAQAAARSVVRLYEEGGLRSPRLQIAHELEGGLLDIAQTQLSAAEKNSDPVTKGTQLAIASFLCGAA